MSMPHDPRPTPRPQAASGDPGDPHDHHDPLLVAQFVGDDVDEAERAEVARWLESCAACVDLAADLRELSAGLGELPTPRRTRDFRLTAADASRLRRPRWRTVIDGLATGRVTWAQPVGATLAALGIVGLLVGTFSLGGPGTAASTALDQMSRAGAAPAFQGATNAPGASAAASMAGSITGSPGPSAAPSSENQGYPVLSPGGSKSAFASASPAPAFNAASLPAGSAPAIGPVPATTTPARAGTTGGSGSGGSGGLARDVLLAASFVLVVVGLGLLALRFVGGRLGAATGR